MPPAFLEGGGGGGQRGGAPIIGQCGRAIKKVIRRTGVGGGGVERGSSIYEQGCNIKSATAFAVLAVVSAPPM